LIRYEKDPMKIGIIDDDDDGAQLLLLFLFRLVEETTRI
jgi:hypothetical protein